jgi:hypothetical protein
MHKHGDRACTRCTKSISILKKEEMGVGERISGVEKEECAAAKIQRRGMVH